MAAQVIKCAKCKGALKAPPNPKPQDRLECPRCGIGDSFKRVIAAVGEYTADQVASAVDRTLDNAFRNSKNVKLTKGPRPHKTRRFIVDLKL